MIIHTQVCKNCKKNKFRPRISHDLCRPCFRAQYGENRPIASRELATNKFRRTRKRRRAVKVTKPITAKRRKSSSSSMVSE